MLKVLILDEDDINVRGYGFNACLVHKDDFELIVDFKAVPKLIEQLVDWQRGQDEIYRENYLRDKFGPSLDASR